MKTHINLAVGDLGKSVAFYATLLNQKPAKVLRDYALFISENPGIELALDLAERVAISRDAHYGVLVDSTDDVERAIERFEAAGFATDVERDETCCYAKQTKVWASDPEGRRWEVYTVLEDTETRNESTTCCGA